MLLGGQGSTRKPSFSLRKTIIRQVRGGPGIDLFPTPVREAPQTAFREPLWPDLGASGTESRIFRVLIS